MPEYLPMLVAISQIPGLAVGQILAYDLDDGVELSARRVTEDSWELYACRQHPERGDVDLEVAVTRWHRGWHRWRVYEVESASGAYDELVTRQGRLEQAVDAAVRHLTGALA